MVAVVLVLPLWGILLFVIVVTPWQPIGMRALWYVAAVGGESIDSIERAARVREGAKGRERPAMVNEGAGQTERTAEPDVSAEAGKRADEHEGAGDKERAGLAESIATNERAASSESADTHERPSFTLGYPRINSASHHLWDAQQAGWPQHLPHEAWRDLVSAQRREDQPRQDSADHPAFAAGYVPNDAATPQVLSEAYIAKRQGKARR